MQRMQLKWWVDVSSATNLEVLHHLESRLRIFRLAYLRKASPKAEREIKEIMNGMGSSTKTVFHALFVTGGDFIPAESLDEAELVFAFDPEVCQRYFDAGKRVIQVRSQDGRDFTELVGTVTFWVRETSFSWLC